jgi:hypothetical protein
MTFDPNPLERALQLAASDAAHRPDFFRLLLQSEVFIVGDAKETEDGDRRVASGTSVAIQQWQQPDGTLVIPFFTSLAAAEQAVEEDVSCLGLPARALFERMRGATLVLNPGLEFGKQFRPQDIEALLAGAVPNSALMRPVQDESDVTLSVPETYPAPMVDALVTFFARRSQVKAAFLALLKHPGAPEGDMDNASRLIVGVHSAGDFETLAREIAAVIADTAPRNERINLYSIAPEQDGIAAALFEHFEPFYDISWGARLSATNTFDGGHA